METRLHPFERLGYALVASLGVALMFIFQHVDFLGVFASQNFNPSLHFIVNRTVRILVNDLSMILLIHAIFADPRVVRLAFFIQVIDLFVLFPIYLALKLPTEGPSELSSPFLSQFHRLIVNPTLMIVLIPAIIFQKVASR
jgi:exosortase F-associated protein